ncbi:hypothetical protein EAF04_000261 [Stromatinia cepivora]|nr:hypothetical protein EAF04_000261 [Stromatinia cepivora]
MTGNQECSECKALLPANHTAMKPCTVECHNTDGNTTATAVVNEKVELSTPKPGETQTECVAVKIHAHGVRITVFISEDDTQPIKVSATRGIVYPDPEKSVSSALLYPV